MFEYQVPLQDILAILRQAVQREMGDAFQLGRYHEAVLAPGPVPVKDLPELVRQQMGLKMAAGSGAGRFVVGTLNP